LSEFGIEARHPDEFLTGILDRHEATVVSKLVDQAATIGRTLPELLKTLKTGVPQFAASVASRLAADIRER
jgi:hypothetical protein